MKRSRLASAIVVTALTSVLFAGLAWAAFTDRETNPQTFQAASTWPMMLHMASGSYTGNGVKGRAIKATTFLPDLVILRGDTNQVAVARTSTMIGDQTKPLVGGVALDNDNITSLNADGFSVGGNNRVNAAGITYHWVALQAGPGTLSVGSYTGNGAATRSITGVGFSPEYVATLDSGNARAVQRFSGMSRSYQFDGDTGQATTRISSLDADGFTIGNANEVNKNGDIYHYFAFNNSPGSVNIGSFTGDGSDNRNIAGVGFQPSYVLLRADNTTTSRSGVNRFTSQSGDSAFPFGAVAAPNLIQSFSADGFQIGTDPTVNQSAAPYFHLALRNTASACQQTGTYSISGPMDTWLDQSAPTGTKPTDQNLKVRSRSGANRRVLVRHTLPGLDPDCELKSAHLVLTATGAKGGRTMQALLVAATWNATTATWSNQPATTGTPLSAPSATVNGGTVDFDVTTQVQGMIAGSITNNGWLIRDAVEDDPGGVEQVFASNESASPDPQLILVIGAP